MKASTPEPLRKERGTGATKGKPHRRAWLWWSGGKDAAWALHEVRRTGIADVVSLATTVNRSDACVPHHKTGIPLIRLQAEAIGLPLRVFDIPPMEKHRAAYDDAMRRIIDTAHRDRIDRMIFGDIALEWLRDYREQRLAGTGITPLFPLWGRPTAEISRAMVCADLRALIVSIDRHALSPRFLGNEFDDTFLDRLPKGVDPCGEEGEFHTFVFGGPMFVSRLGVYARAGVTRGRYVTAQIVAGHHPKTA
jgi:uncharacterized protein (TIGR00290 family)